MKITERIEQFDGRFTTENGIQISIAISLKRIADSLEKIATMPDLAAIKEAVAGLEARLAGTPRVTGGGSGVPVAPHPAAGRTSC